MNIKEKVERFYYENNTYASKGRQKGRRGYEKQD
jgi:hypothetical protein